jgi:surface carbohydrate biosynthesis protein
MSRKRVVILVDNRWRDLNQAGLIAHHLERRGVQCCLEPLEATRASLPAHRPHLLLFNHLLTSTLANYSRRLHEAGVLTAVLPNEGIYFDAGELEFNAAKFHNNAHVDLFFCWNRVHADALVSHGGQSRDGIHVVGVPRFDFYFPPWSEILPRADRSTRRRPQLLLCTNFVLARYTRQPRIDADRLFAPWKDRVASYRDYWGIIQASAVGQERIFGFLNALAAESDWDLLVRPHPNEEIDLYRAWRNGLSAARQERVTVDREAHISSVLMDCDLEIACETCTTSMESWIIGKPTIELVMARHPVLFHPEMAALHPNCDRSDALVALVRANLRPGAQQRFSEGRRQHLEKWCASPAGNSSERIAEVICHSLEGRPEPRWSGFNFTDKRRAAKMRLLKTLDLPYNFNPFLPLLSAVAPGRYAAKVKVYEKTPKPADVRRLRKLFKELGRTAVGPNRKPD